MKDWYYRFVKLETIRNIVDIISYGIRLLAVLDAALMWVLQLDVFDKIIDKVNFVFHQYFIPDDIKTNLYFVLAFLICGELLLRVIRYFLKPENALLRDENKQLKRSNGELIEKNENLQSDCKFLKDNYQNTISGYLHSYAKNKLGFGKDGHNNDRITLFSYDSNSGEFILQGRYSPNDQYQQNGKYIYPKEGLLYEAFNRNEGVFDNNFPEPTIENNTISDEYWRYHKSKYGLTKDTVLSLTMKSTLMCGYVIKDNSEGDKIGVVIVESTERDRFGKDDLLRAMEDERKIFRNFIKHGHGLLRKNLKTEGL